MPKIADLVVPTDLQVYHTVDYPSLRLLRVDSIVPFFMIGAYIRGLNWRLYDSFCFRAVNTEFNKQRIVMAFKANSIANVVLGMTGEFRRLEIHPLLFMWIHALVRHASQPRNTVNVGRRIFAPCISSLFGIVTRMRMLCNFVRARGLSVNEAMPVYVFADFANMAYDLAQVASLNLQFDVTRRHPHVRMLWDGMLPNASKQLLYIRTTCVEVDTLKVTRTVICRCNTVWEGCEEVLRRYDSSFFQRSCSYSDTCVGSVNDVRTEPVCDGAIEEDYSDDAVSKLFGDDNYDYSLPFDAEEPIYSDLPAIGLEPYDESFINGSYMFERADVGLGTGDTHGSTFQ